LLEAFEQNNAADSTPVACLRTELYCFTFNESSSQGKCADCRSRAWLQKVEQISYPKAFAFEIGRAGRSCFEEVSINLGRATAHRHRPRHKGDVTSAKEKFAMSCGNRPALLRASPVPK
jgi:hypothetical protein